MSTNKKKRIVVIGGVAAGTSVVVAKYPGRSASVTTTR